jgi:hypothetical protein
MRDQLRSELNLPLNTGGDEEMCDVGRHHKFVCLFGRSISETTLYRSPPQHWSESPSTSLTSGRTVRAPSAHRIRTTNYRRVTLSPLHAPPSLLISPSPPTSPALLYVQLSRTVGSSSNFSDLHSNGSDLLTSFVWSLGRSAESNAPQFRWLLTRSRTKGCHMH